MRKTSDRTSTRPYAPRAGGRRRLPAAGCCLLAALVLHGAAAAQQHERRMVIATHVACRVAPDVTAAPLRQYRLGEMLYPAQAAETADGMWYLDTMHARGDAPGCWIHGGLTAPATPLEHALLAAADRVLARTDDVPFEDYVAVDNLLTQTPGAVHGTTTVLEASPLLQLRRLQVLEAATAAPGTYREEVERSPLKAAWFFAHRDVLRFFEPAGGWMVPAEVFWELHERQRGSPAAEEMAWAAARAAVPADECDAPCVLDAIARTYARYVAAHPTGERVGEALARAQQQLEYAVQVGCFDGGRELAQLAPSLRESVSAVAPAEKQEFLALVDQVVRRCQVPRRVG